MKMLRNLAGYNGNLDEVKTSRGIYRTNRDTKPSVALAQSFGAGTGADSYNYRLANAVLASREIFGERLPAIVQAEVGECLENYGGSNYYIVGENDVYSEGESSSLMSKIDTAGVLEASRDLIKSQGGDITNVVYVAHPAHIERVMQIGEKMGLEGIPFIEKEVVWPTNDSQKWVRSKGMWVPREIATRIHHKIKGLI